MKNLYLLIGLFTLIASCKKDDDNNPGNTPGPNNEVQLTSYPLAVGNSWEYSITETSSDSTGVLSTEYSFSRWTVISDTVINGLTSAKIYQYDSAYSGAVTENYSYYANTPDGLFGLAYEGYGTNIILRKYPAFIPGYGLKFTTAGIDSVNVLPVPFQHLKFPSSINTSWTAEAYDDTTLILEHPRSYTDYRTVTVPAGTYSCIRVKGELENNGQIFPYIQFSDFSVKGLIAADATITLDIGNGPVTFNKIVKLTNINF